VFEILVALTTMSLLSNAVRMTSQKLVNPPGPCSLRVQRLNGEIERTDCFNSI